MSAGARCTGSDTAGRDLVDRNGEGHAGDDIATTCPWCGQHLPPA